MEKEYRFTVSWISTKIVYRKLFILSHRLVRKTNKTHHLLQPFGAEWRWCVFIFWSVISGQKNKIWRQHSDLLSLGSQGVGVFGSNTLLRSFRDGGSGGIPL